MNHTNAFDLKVIRRPERKDEKKTDEEERPGRVVFLVFSHWFIRWSGGGPDVDVCWRDSQSVHSSGAPSVAASVGRLRKASVTRRVETERRRQADHVSACRSVIRHTAAQHHSRCIQMFVRPRLSHFPRHYITLRPKRWTNQDVHNPP